jgi:hypothetical protein
LIRPGWVALAAVAAVVGALLTACDANCGPGPTWFPRGMRVIDASDPDLVGASVVLDSASFEVHYQRDGHEFVATYALTTFASASPETGG